LNAVNSLLKKKRPHIGVLHRGREAGGERGGGEGNDLMYCIGSRNEKEGEEIKRIVLFVEIEGWERREKMGRDQTSAAHRWRERGKKGKGGGRSFIF